MYLDLLIQAPRSPWRGTVGPYSVISMPEGPYCPHKVPPRLNLDCRLFRNEVGFLYSVSLLGSGQSLSGAVQGVLYPSYPVHLVTGLRKCLALTSMQQQSYAGPDMSPTSVISGQLSLHYRGPRSVGSLSSLFWSTSNHSSTIDTASSHSLH